MSEQSNEIEALLRQAQRAEPVVRELLSDFGDVRYVWRPLPLNDVHGSAQR